MKFLDYNEFLLEAKIHRRTLWFGIDKFSYEEHPDKILWNYFYGHFFNKFLDNQKKGTNSSYWFKLDKDSTFIPPKDSNSEYEREVFEYLQELFEQIKKDTPWHQEPHIIMDALLEKTPIFMNWWKRCSEKWRGKVATKRFGF